MTPIVGRRPRVTRWILPVMIAVPLAAGCGGSSSPADVTAGASATAGTAPPAARPSGSLPPEAAAKPGGKYYAVFLAVAADANDAKLTDAQQRAKALGYQGGVGDVNCTPGARTALNLADSGSYTAFSIFFADNKQAQDFINAYSGPIAGTAYVTAGCLD